MLHCITDRLAIQPLTDAELKRLRELAGVVGVPSLRSAKLSPEIRELAALARSVKLDNLAASLYHRILELEPAASEVRSALTALYQEYDLRWSVDALRGGSLEPERVSVYVPCFNVAAYLESCLTAIFAQSYPVLEVLVIDDGSTDATREIAARFPVRIIPHGSNRGLSCARNTALAHARGELLAGVDADVTLDRFWLERCVSRLQGSRYAGVGGRLLETHRFSLADQWRSRLMAQHHGSSPKENVDIYGCNSLFRVEALRAVGGFDERYRTSFDDIDLCQRLRAAGYATVYDPQAFCFHQRRDSIYSLSKSAYRWRVPPYEQAGAFDSVEKVSLKWIREFRFAISEVPLLFEEGIGILSFPALYMAISSMLQDVLEFARRRAREPLELPFAYLSLMRMCRDANTLPALVREVCAELLTTEFLRESPARLRDDTVRLSAQPLSSAMIREYQSRLGGDEGLLRVIESTLEGLDSTLAFSPHVQGGLSQGAQLIRDDLQEALHNIRPQVVVFGDDGRAELEAQKLCAMGMWARVVSVKSSVDDPVGTLEALSCLAPELVLLATDPALSPGLVALGAQLGVLVPTVKLRVADGVGQSDLPGWARL